MESYLTTGTKATPALLNALSESSNTAGKPSTREQNSIQARLMFLKARLLQLHELHRQALKGLIELTVGEFISMQQEMNNINYELNHA